MFVRRGVWAENPDVLAEASTDFVIRVADLTRFGLSNSTIANRCRSGGPWQRLLPGVVLTHSGVPTARQRAIAALAYGSKGAVLTGRAALREYGYGRYDGDVHILLPDRRRAQSVSFVLVERTVRLPEPVIRNSLPCAPLPRAVLDAARRLSTLDRVRALIAEVVQRGDVTVEELSAELEDGSVRGSALPRTVLEEVNANVHSVTEAEARKLWLRSGLPEMVFNVDVVSSTGEFIARPDGWIDSVAFAWDIDSLDWHLSPERYIATTERRARMQSHGIIVLPTVPKAIRERPDDVLRHLVAHYRLASSRPRPAVRISPRSTD